MNKQTLAELQSAAVKRIFSGDLTEDDLKTIIKGESSNPKRVVRSFDVFADGKVRNHVTTEEEVFDFTNRIKDPKDLERMMGEMPKRREDYLKKCENAGIARKELGKKQQQVEG